MIPGSRFYSSAATAICTRSHLTKRGGNLPMDACEDGWRFLESFALGPSRQGARHEHQQSEIASLTLRRPRLKSCQTQRDREPHGFVRVKSASADPLACHGP
jgi:hypothetical protein